MPVTFTQTITKPSDKQWFAQVSAENQAKSAAINAWTETCPGFISHNYDKSNPDVRIYTAVFDTVENYAAWNTNRFLHPDMKARGAHNAANGITWVNEETIS